MTPRSKAATLVIGAVGCGAVAVIIGAIRLVLAPDDGSPVGSELWMTTPPWLPERAARPPEGGTHNAPRGMNSVPVGHAQRLP